MSGPVGAGDLKSILLIKPGSLGDVVHALPCAAELKKAYPSARLAWVVDPRWASILDGANCVDLQFPFPREDFRGTAGFIRGTMWLRSCSILRPDLAIDLQCLLRSGIIARAARARHIVGLSDAREGAQLFYDETALVGPVQHAVDRYLQVLPLLGRPLPPNPEFPLGPGEPLIHADLADAFVLLHPFARGAGKALSNEQIFRFVSALPDHRIVIAGLGTAPPNLPRNALDLTNKTSLQQLLWLARKATVVVSADSGPMHLAAAVCPGLLAIHTRTDPRKVGPYSESAFVWQGGEIRPQTLSPSAPFPRSTPITDRDINAIAQWVEATVAARRN